MHVYTIDVKHRFNTTAKHFFYFITQRSLLIKFLAFQRHIKYASFYYFFNKFRIIGIYFTLFLPYIKVQNDSGQPTPLTLLGISTCIPIIISLKKASGEYHNLLIKSLTNCFDLVYEITTNLGSTSFG